MVTRSLRPKARKKTFFEQVKADVKTDFGYFSAAIKGEKYNDPNPERTASRAARSRAAQEDLRKRDRGSKSKAAPAAPAAAAPDPKAVAAARMKAEGRKNRKKFEDEKGKKVKKRRKLLLNIKEASS